MKSDTRNQETLNVEEAIRKGEASDLPFWSTIPRFCKSGILEVKARTLQNWCTTGYYPNARKVGRNWYINWRDFVAWFERIGRLPLDRRRWYPR